MRALWRHAPLVVAGGAAAALLALPHPSGPLGRLLGWSGVALCGLVLLAAAGVSPFLSSEEFARSGLADIDELTGEEFELRLQVMYSSLGYTVRTTPRSGDFGRDLLLINGVGRKTVVQAKRYSSNVGIEAVQEASAARLHYGASSAVVVTNSRFTKAAQELAASNGVGLIDREELEALLAGQCSEPVAGGKRLLVHQAMAGCWPLVTLVGRAVLMPLRVLGWCARVVL